MNGLHIASGILLVVTAAVHSLLGERRLIAPLLALDSGAVPPRLCRAVRFTWHMATLLMLLTALTVGWPGTPVVIVRVIGAAYLLLGLLSLAVTRGRHVSGPLFTGAGVLALFG